jgi:hypothetical protein
VNDDYPLTASGVLLLLSVLSMHGYLAMFKSWDKAVKGSHQRYMYATVAIIANHIMLVMPVLLGIVYWVEGKPSLVSVPFIALTIILTKICPVPNDDSWFSRQWSKIKNGVKNFVASVQFRPATTTAA